MHKVCCSRWAAPAMLTLVIAHHSGLIEFAGGVRLPRLAVGLVEVSGA